MLAYGLSEPSKDECPLIVLQNISICHSSVCDFPKDLTAVDWPRMVLGLGELNVLTSCNYDVKFWR